MRGNASLNIDIYRLLCSRAAELSKSRESRRGKRDHTSWFYRDYRTSCGMSHCCALVVRNLSDRLRTLVRMKTKAQRRLAALRAVAEQNEKAAQANTIDAVDNEAVEVVRCINNDKTHVRASEVVHVDFRSHEKMDGNNGSGADFVVDKVRVVVLGLKPLQQYCICDPINAN